MIIYCRGKAVIEQKGTGQQFEIEPDLLDFDSVGGSERSMGPEYQYQAVIEHEVLGELSWGLWEYPVGIENYKRSGENSRRESLSRGDCWRIGDFGLENHNVAFNNVRLANILPPHKAYLHV